MSSYSLPSPRISGGSQRSSPDHRHFRLSASSRARCKASGSSAKEPTSNGAAQSPNRQQATSATKSVPTADNLSSLLYLPASLLGMTMDLTVVGGHRHGRRNIRIRRQGTAALRPKLG